MYDTPDDLRRAAWHHMARGVADRHHPARHPTFGTINADGPQLRTVVLRGWSQTGIAEVHTDSASTKVTELQNDPRAALHIWIPKQDLQLRLTARARLIHNDPDRWARIPDGARIVYGGTPAPGVPITAPADHAPGATLDRFTAIELMITALDIVHLGQDVHRRVRATRIESTQADPTENDSGWSSLWIAP